MLRGDDIFEAEICWPIRIVSSQSRRNESPRALMADPKSECLMHVVRSLGNIIGCKSVPLPDPTIHHQQTGTRGAYLYLSLIAKPNGAND
jgi:hypothetical protein